MDFIGICNFKPKKGAIDMDLITKLNNFVMGMGIDYAICGGHAIDLFLGHKTRPHKDLDVVVFWEDRDKVIQYMLNDGWEIYEPCGMEHLHKINNIHNQKRAKSNIWCVRPNNPHYTFTEQGVDMFAVEFDNSEQTDLDYIEFLFNTRNGEDFLYARNHDVKMKLKAVILKSKDIPYLAPEMVLLYKSTADSEAAYQLDFENTLPKLSNEQLCWLKNALCTMFPKGHRWRNAIKVAIPDFPSPFGYKVCWYAIKNETPHSVIEKLNLKVVRASNWEDGINYIYDSRDFIFVSPQVEGYILVINVRPDNEHDIVKGHALLFEELQYFGTHRVVEYNAWAKFADGKIIRSYCYIGDRGEITWCEGHATDEEISLGFDKFPSSTDEILSEDFDHENTPNEEDVLNIAKSWGVDTRFECGTYEKGTGFICKGDMYDL